MHSQFSLCGSCSFAASGPAAVSHYQQLLETYPLHFPISAVILKWNRLWR